VHHWDIVRFSFLSSIDLVTCICLTAGVNLLTPSGHRQIRDVITTGIDMCGRRMQKGGEGDGLYIRRGAD